MATETVQGRNRGRARVEAYRRVHTDHGLATDEPVSVRTNT